MKKKSKLSICMIVRDEEKYLEACLKSLKPLMDCDIAELIIVDTGSLDDTVEIANRYTDKVYFKKWNNNFSEARNYSISKAEGEYVFIMDADQDMEEVEVNKIIKLFSKEEYKRYNTIFFKIINYLNENLLDFSSFKLPLIFKNDGYFKYEGAVHNQPKFKEKYLYSEMKINHYGYIMNEEIKIKKFNRTATILKDELKKNPNNIYYLYQLTKSLNSIGNFKEGKEQVDKYIEILKNDYNLDNLKYYRTAAQTYFLNKELEKSIRICDNILEKYEKFLDAIYLKALILYESKKFKDSKFYIEEYKKVLKDKKEFEVYGVEMFSESSFNNIEKILNKINDVLLFDKLLFNMKENIVELIKKNDINVLKFIEEIKKSGVYFEINDSEFYNILGVAYYNFGFLEEALKEIDNGLIKF